MRPFCSFPSPHRAATSIFRLLDCWLPHFSPVSPFRTHPKVVSSSSLTTVGASTLAWLWPVTVCTLCLPRPTSALVITLIWLVCEWFPLLLSIYFHSVQIVATDHGHFGVVIVFVLDHVGHLLQLLLSPLRFFGSDACMSKWLPKSASSISLFLAMYLLLSDLLLLVACDFWVRTKYIHQRKYNLITNNYKNIVIVKC